jgi:hypothetical protein
MVAKLNKAECEFPPINTRASKIRLDISCIDGLGNNSKITRTFTQSDFWASLMSPSMFLEHDRALVPIVVACDGNLYCN